MFTERKKRKIIDVSACRECFCLVFKVFPGCGSQRSRERKKGVDEELETQE